MTDETVTPSPKRSHEWQGKQRPWRYSKPAADRLLDRIRSGMSLRQIAEGPGLPTLGTIDNWLRENPEFFALYESARRFRCEVLADDVADVASAEKSAALAAKKFRFEVLKWDIEARARAEAAATDRRS